MAIHNLTNQFNDLVERQKARDEQILEIQYIIDTLKRRIAGMESDVIELASEIFGETSDEDVDTARMGTGRPHGSGESGHVQMDTGADAVGQGQRGRRCTLIRRGGGE